MAAQVEVLHSIALVNVLIISAGSPERLWKFIVWPRRLYPLGQKRCTVTFKACLPLSVSTPWAHSKKSFARIDTRRSCNGLEVSLVLCVTEISGGCRSVSQESNRASLSMPTTSRNFSVTSFSSIISGASIASGVCLAEHNTS